MRKILFRFTFLITVLVTGYSLAIANPPGTFQPLELFNASNFCGINATTFSNTATATAPGNGNNNTWTLSGGNLTATNSPPGAGTTSLVTSIAGFTSPKKIYAEVKVTAVGNGAIIGIIKSGDDITHYLGSSANAYSYHSNTGLKENNGTTAAYGSAYVNNDVIGIAFDGTSLWFSLNNVWQNGASISEVQNGTTTHVAYTGLSGTFYVGVSENSSVGGPYTYIANYGASAFAGTVPVGFSGGVCAS